MMEVEHQQVIDELQGVIDDARATMERFEATDMDERMPDDYDKLHEIYAKAVRDQWHYTQAMLQGGE
ncbi:hypothetical protein [Litchfieldella rifensis]|uniref:Uncharacterized protein n=1 Tax=Litchfieldella rifensis TaxID=762643 RepID=A0ABV7LW75_9GAMM